LKAFGEIQKAMDEHPEVLVRCSSEFPFYPAVQKMVEWYRSGAFGQIIEAKFAIKHSSDMDLNKPINWKRTLSATANTAALGDLGIIRTTCRSASAMPKSVSAQLPGEYCRMAAVRKTRACETWDNAFCSRRINEARRRVPLTFEMSAWRRADPLP
jgi:hypothetical protein